MALRILFRFDTPASVEPWAAMDDRVMGGASRSRLRFDPAGHALFEGEVSLAQGGGFASVRSQPGALAGFRPSFRGRAVPGAPPLDPARLRQVGLMIAERQAGPFALALRSIGLA